MKQARIRIVLAAAALLAAESVNAQSTRGGKSAMLAPNGTPMSAEISTATSASPRDGVVATRIR